MASSTLIAFDESDPHFDTQAKSVYIKINPYPGDLVFFDGPVSIYITVDGVTTECILKNGRHIDRKIGAFVMQFKLLEKIKIITSSDYTNGFSKLLHLSPPDTLKSIGIYSITVDATYMAGIEEYHVPYLTGMRPNYIPKLTKILVLNIYDSHLILNGIAYQCYRNDNPTYDNSHLQDIFDNSGFFKYKFSGVCSIDYIHAWTENIFERNPQIEVFTIGVNIQFGDVTCRGGQN